MRYTFADAKRILATAGMSHSGTDLGEKINNAVLALAGMSGWEFLRRLVRTFSAGPVIALPQGSAGLVRACINGRPASIHATDYQFLHSGPGDLSSVPPGFRMLQKGDIADIGWSAVMTPLPGPTQFAAVSPYVSVEKPGDGYRPQPPVTVSGVTADGERVSAKYEVIQGDVGTYPALTKFDGPQFASVESVVLGDGTDEHITLFGCSQAGSLFVAGHYHPSIKVPQFHMYQIAPTIPGPYDILAEVRIEPLPCINDEDVVPLPSLEPVKFMLLYDYNLSINEIQTAQQYQQMAVAWLAQMQVTDNTVQTPVVQNVLFEGSPGDLGDGYEFL